MMCDKHTCLPISSAAPRTTVRRAWIDASPDLRRRRVLLQAAQDRVGVALARLGQSSAAADRAAAIRGAGWLEAAVLLAAARGEVGWIAEPTGGGATASVAADGTIRVQVRAGDPLDETTLRSYCTGAAHMGLGLVRSESIAVDPETGEIHDLTIRSFGVVRAVDTPTIEIDVLADERPAVNGSDAVMAAVAAAVWLADGTPTAWPTSR